MLWFVADRFGGRIPTVVHGRRGAIVLREQTLLAAAAKLFTCAAQPLLASPESFACPTQTPLTCAAKAQLARPTQHALARAAHAHFAAAQVLPLAGAPHLVLAG